VTSVTLSLALTGGCFAQSNGQNNKETETQLKHEEKNRQGSGQGKQGLR